MSVIHHFNLAGVDLNLLVVFDALMTSQHLTRAAEKIGLSQPATSNALSRLRKLFKDDLFIKTSKGMTPTPKAIELAEFIHEVLLQVQTAIYSESQFIPKQSDRIFRLGMDDYSELVFLPKLLKQLEILAPKVKIQVRSTNWMRSPKLLDADEIDLAIGHCPQFQAWHTRQLLYQEHFVCLFAEKFLFQKAIALEEYIAASHLLVSPKEDMVGLVDKALALQNLSRNVAMSVPNFLIVPFILVNTNLIATLPAQLVKTFVEVWQLYASPLPFEMTGFSVDILWHNKNDRDQGHIWLRNLISQICVN
ncbi:LysR family transcriptional regulator [Hassallia byssoidea VB512170]|uniref:LysR family transcriptional regulator n=1 Tax=Hassallia byssoidea VB512170 TaxID=1304833 RepID=A0A846H481_9CYAN|nr:LysR family transcriptional regulator [Hassalia byssoidea]NEU72236.1 LysR family transcriptional regulator [Hassalia byssoidea VB512170]